MNKLFYCVVISLGVVGCSGHELHNNGCGQRYTQQDTVDTSFSLDTRQDIDKIPNGYGLKGFRRISVDGKIVETKGTLSRLRDKDIQDSQHYYGGSILPGELEIIPPAMIRPLDGSEGNPLYLNVVAKFIPVAPLSIDNMKKFPLPKYITRCNTFYGSTTCTTY